MTVTESETIPTLAEKVEFLRRPEVYARPTASVETVETHMAWVFLTEDRAYKLKKPVRFSFLDFHLKFLTELFHHLFGFALDYTATQSCQFAHQRHFALIAYLCLRWRYIN